MPDTYMATAPSELRHRILLVDDDVDERDALTCFLEMEGVAVSAAAEGREALYALRTGLRPCVIVLDLDMPGMDGWEFRRQQLFWPQMRSIPVLILSGHPELNAVNDSTAHAQSGYSNVWKIDASLLWNLMRQQTMKGGGHLGGYYYFSSNAFLYMRHPAW